MSKKLFGSLHAIVVVLQALLWLRIVFVLFNVQLDMLLVKIIMKVTDVLVRPFDGLFGFNLYVLNFRVDLAALFIIVILDIISYTILEIKKGYE